MEAGHKYQYKSNAHNIQLCTTSNTFVNNLKIGYKYHLQDKLTLKSNEIQREERIYTPH